MDFFFSDADKYMQLENYLSVTCIWNKSQRWNVVILVSRIREGRGSQRKQSRRSCSTVWHHILMRLRPNSAERCKWIKFRSTWWILFAYLAVSCNYRVSTGDTGFSVHIPWYEFHHLLEGGGGGGVPWITESTQILQLYIGRGRYSEPLKLKEP